MSAVMEIDKVRVFIDYAEPNKGVAEKIFAILRDNNIPVWLDDFLLLAGDSIWISINKALYASDYLMILLSQKSVSSTWLQREVSQKVLRELANRDITVLPVLIEDCEIPLALRGMQYWDLRGDFEAATRRLAEELRNIPSIDFDKLAQDDFTRLVGDLLETLGFINLRYEVRAENGREFDILGEYTQRDPFGSLSTDRWIVETKLYGHQRADVPSLQQLLTYVAESTVPSSGLLVTNSYLTSVAREWLEQAERSTPGRVRVIDGAELKRLLIQHPDLIAKYFPRELAVK